MPLYDFKSTDSECDFVVWKQTESTEELKSLACLTDDENAVYSAFKNEKRRREWLSVRAALNVFYEEKIRVLYRDNGSPFIDDDRCISISHSGDFVIAILSDKKVGVDIEQNTARIHRVAPKFLNDSELLLCNGDGFCLTLLWCVKEALYKHQGRSDVDFSEDFICSTISDDEVTGFISWDNTGFTAKYRSVENCIVAWVVK
jgi:phosphopantetheinyl transferase